SRASFLPAAVATPAGTTATKEVPSGSRPAAGSKAKVDGSIHRYFPGGEGSRRKPIPVVAMGWLNETTTAGTLAGTRPSSEGVTRATSGSVCSTRGGGGASSPGGKGASTSVGCGGVPQEATADIASQDDAARAGKRFRVRFERPATALPYKAGAGTWHSRN